MKKVVVSGGFDPVHVGHIRMFKEAKKLGEKLIVILNNDNWLRSKKDYCFMNEDDRKEILESIKYVDDVLISFHEVNDKDTGVTRELSFLTPDVFANGGDRTDKNTPEQELCELLGIEMVFNVGGEKVRSSSELVGDKRDI